MAEMKISNTLVNDTSTGEIAYAEQLKDRLLKDYIANSPDITNTDRERIPADMKAAAGVFQEKLNEFFLKHWVDFQRFLYDEGVDPETIDSWYEVKRFLDGLDDDTSMWLKNKLQSMDTYMYNIDNIDGGAFDISAANNDGGVFARYASLAAALAAIPQESRKSGMSIRYIDAGTGKYEQYRYLGSSVGAGFTNTNNWQYAGNDVFIDNPTWIKVISDAEGKILFGIDKEGNIEWSKGVPTPVREKLSELAASVSESIKSLDEKKADGEYIDHERWIKLVTDAEGRILWGIKSNGDIEHGRGIPSPTKKYVDAFNAAVNERIDGLYIENGLSEYINNEDWIFAVTEHDGHILFGVRADGSFETGKGVPSPVKKYINDIYESLTAQIEEIEASLLDNGYIESDDWINVETDNDGRILSGTRTDGSHYIRNVDSETILKEVQFVDTASHQDYIEATTDNEGRLLEYRKADGTLVEEKMEIESLTLGEDAQGYLKELFGGQVNNDWSQEEKVVLPMPEEGAMVNLIIPESCYNTAEYQRDKGNYSAYIDNNGHIKYGLAYKKGLDWQCEIEYWDKKGNYFRKPIELNAQGNSSMGFEVNNQAIDLTDGSEIKIGGWVSQDSFHLKKYYQDVFRGQCIVAYRLMEQVMQTRSLGERRPWDYLDTNDSLTEGNGSFKEDFDTGALAHPDGFPVELFCNGSSLGVYTFNLKKHRDNYQMKKTNTSHILLDGVLGGNEFWKGSIIWEGNYGSTSGFEVRNPKPKKKSDGWELTCIDGEKYDGDEHAVELMGTDTAGYDSSNESHVKSAQVKSAIVRLSNALSAIAAESTTELMKAKALEYFNMPFLIDYHLVSTVIYNYDGYRKNWIWGTWDGLKWSPTIYDCDSIFGSYFKGNRIERNHLADMLGNGSLPSQMLLSTSSGRPLRGLFYEETKQRYAELRNLGILSVDNIMLLLEQWLMQAGYDRIKNDIENIFPYTPSYRDHRINTEYWELVFDKMGTDSGVVQWDASSTYEEGTLVRYTTNEYCYRAITSVPAGEAPCELYPYEVREGGMYNSPKRVRRWLEARLAFVDNHYQYEG